MTDKEYSKIMQEIGEREQLIECFMLYGGFDRAYAIMKIKEFDDATCDGKNLQPVDEMQNEQLLGILQSQSAVLMDILKKAYDNK